MSPSRLSMFLLVAAPLALGACRKKPATTPPVQPPPATSGPVTPPPATNNNTPAPRDTMAEINAATVRARASLLEKIFFEYDADELSAEARTNLDNKIAIMNANPNLRIRVAGHADERGSDEYNIALGRRRAEAAKRYLTDRGVAAARIETTTFGRERPAVQGSTEEAWSQNRRDEFEIVAGGEQLRAP